MDGPQAERRWLEAMRDLVRRAGGPRDARGRLHRPFRLVCGCHREGEVQPHCHADDLAMLAVDIAEAVRAGDGAGAAGDAAGSSGAAAGSGGGTVPPGGGGDDSRPRPAGRSARKQRQKAARREGAAADGS